MAAILLAAQSPDPAARTQAEAVLKQAEGDFPSYVTTLAGHLAAENADAESRRLAGLILKNAVSSSSRATRDALHARWAALDNTTVKPGVRACLFQALASPVAPQARRAAAQVISKIAAVELPVPGTWDNLIPDLLASTTRSESPDHLRQAALEALGYICEEAGAGDIDPRVLNAYSNQILTALVHGMQFGANAPAVEGQSPEAAAEKAKSAAAVRLTATRSLNDALEFASAQFGVDHERTAIMETIYLAAKNGDVETREAALMGLCKIGEHYYDKLPEYMQWLFELTENAIRSDQDAIALQGIEFWNTVAEEEIALAEEEEASRDLNIAPDRTSQKFVASALPFLANPILECLKQQDDDPLEDDAWNRSTAAGVCLELLAQAAPGTILDLVLPFVHANITDQANWRSRDAAILAFGAVLEGPPHEELKKLVQEAFPVLMEALLNDPSVAVQDSTAWTLGRVIQVDRDVTVANLPALVESLRGALTRAESPVLAGHICFAMHNLAERFLDEADQESGSLREFAEVILRALLFATSREDGAEGNLRTNAYEALGMMLNAVSKDCLTYVQLCLPMLLEKLEATLLQLKSDLGEDDVNEIIEVEGLLCGALLQATQRLQGSSGLEQFADRLMSAYLQLLSFNRQGAQEEAMCALATFARCSGPSFEKYMTHVMPPLAASLANHDHYHLCRVANAAVQDICTALGPRIVPYADNIVYLMLEALQSPTLDKTVKPPIISCFSDIATAVQGQFENYLNQVMARMREAAMSSVTVDAASDDYDLQDWLLSLRESIFEAYVGIIHGLMADNKQQLLVPHVEWLLQFCEAVVAPTSPSHQVGADLLTKAATSALGDLVVALPEIRVTLRQRPWIVQLLERGGQSKDEMTREVSTWAQAEIFAG